MTDKEIMFHRFHNLGCSTGQLAKSLGIGRKEYEDACRRAMEEESKEYRESKRVTPTSMEEQKQKGGVYRIFIIAF